MIHVMVCGGSCHGLWWFVVVQYMPVKLKIGVASFDVSASTGVMVHGSS